MEKLKKSLQVGEGKSFSLVENKNIEDKCIACIHKKVCKLRPSYKVAECSHYRVDSVNYYLRRN